MLHNREIEVINKIRNSNDPERSLQIAMQIILDHLEKLESSPEQSPAQMQEACAAI